MTPTSATTSEWRLEVVRGRDPGRAYPLGPQPLLLGNALGGAPGIELGDQEGDAPRRMAARQARLEIDGAALVIRDLDSPGGTFVNRQRLPPATARPLGDGDLIQLGAVQLRVVRAGPRPAPVPPPSPPAPGEAGAFSFPMRGGSVCRSWDDFLAVSAQKWADLRDELTSGRLAGFLVGIGRPDLVPEPNALGSPDERLDAWIGLLPTTRPAEPELEVHPRSLIVRQGAAGGVTRRKIQIINAGYRLLRTNARIDPVDASWLKLVPAEVGGPLLTIDSSEIVVEITMPEAQAWKTSAAVVIEGNGGIARVPISVEPASPNAPGPPFGASAIPRPSFAVRDRIARQGWTARLISWGLAGAALRSVLAIGDRVVPSEGPAPALLGPSILFGGLGMAVAVVLAARRAEARDLPAVGLTGGLLGAMAAALMVALARLIDPIAGGSTFASVAAWALLAAGLAGLSLWLVPHRHATGPTA